MAVKVSHFQELASITTKCSVVSTNYPDKLIKNRLISLIRVVRL